MIRTGWGRSYFQEIFGAAFNYTTFGYPSLITQQIPQPTPFTSVFTLAEGPPSVQFPELPESGEMPVPVGISQSYRPNDLAFSYVDSWNFSLERLLIEDLTATVSYVGTIGHNLRQGIPLNQAIPGPGPLNPRRPLFNQFGLTQGINDASNKGTNNYHALQTKLNKRFSAGFSLLASYTWSKSINNSQGLLLNGRLNRGLADWDRKHVVSVGYTWMLPFGRGQGLVRQVLGVWEFIGAMQFQSGLPFSPSMANNASLNADASLRPDIVQGADPYDVPGGQNRDLWFNIGTYQTPGPFMFGNAGRNSLRGPGLITADWALHKRFVIAEQKDLTLRWEVFNVFNRTNLGNPNGNIDAGAGNAGRITGLFSPMRQMQLGVRFVF